MKKMLNLLKGLVNIDKFKTWYKVTILENGEVIKIDYKSITSIGVEKRVKKDISKDALIIKVELANEGI